MCGWLHRFFCVGNTKRFLLSSRLHNRQSFDPGMWVAPIWKVCPLSTAFVSDSKQLDEGRLWSFHWALKLSEVPEVLSSDLGDKVTFLESVLSFLLHFLLPCFSVRVNFKLFWLMSTVVILVKYSRKLSSKESSDDKLLQLNSLKAILLKWMCQAHPLVLSLQSAKNAHIHLLTIHDVQPQLWW